MDFKKPLELEIMEIYQFLYTDCIYESSYATISIHKTKKGAYEAMRRFLIEKYNKWYEERIKYGKDKYSISDTHPFIHEDWCISSLQLKD